MRANGETRRTLVFEAICVALAVIGATAVLVVSCLGRDRVRREPEKPESAIASSPAPPAPTEEPAPATPQTLPAAAPPPAAAPVDTTTVTSAEVDAGTERVTITTPRGTPPPALTVQTAPPALTVQTAPPATVTAPPVATPTATAPPTATATATPGATATATPAATATASVTPTASVPPSASASAPAPAPSPESTMGAGDFITAPPPDRSSAWDIMADAGR